MTQEHLDRARRLSEGLPPVAGPAGAKARADALTARMRQAGLLAVCVPERFGGPGLGTAEIAAVTFEIARQSGSAGLIYAMHMSQAVSVTQHGEGPFFDALQRRMAAEQLLIASGTSEKGPGGDILTSLCAVENGPDGRLRIVKESPNISYVDHADLILVTANRVSEKGRKRQVLVAAEVDRAAFEPGREAQFLGMRGILNRPWRFAVDFPAEAVFPGEFGAIARATMTPSIHIFWAALWSGIAWSAVEKAKRFVGETGAQAGDAETVVALELTRLVDRHHMMNAVIRDALRAYANHGAERDMGFALSAQINRLKVVCSELAVEICTKALALIGIRGYAAGGPYSVAEEIADILSAPVMVSNLRLSLNTARIERFVDERL